MQRKHQIGRKADKDSIIISLMLNKRMRETMLGRIESNERALDCSLHLLETPK